MFAAPRYDFRKATAIDLVRAGTASSQNMIVGGRNWPEFDRFDIAERTDPDTLPGTVRLMLRSLLADRFGLVLHKDTTPTPSFNFTVRGGMVAADDTDLCAHSASSISNGATRNEVGP